MSVPKAFRAGNKVLLACDKRSEQIEMGNAQKEGDYSLPFEFSPASFSAAAARAAAGLLRKWHRVVVGTHWRMDVGSEPCQVEAAINLS